MQVNLSLVLFLLCSFNCALAFSKCQCTPDASPFPGSNASPPASITLSNESEVIDGNDQGKIIAVGTIQILQKVFSIDKQSSAQFKSNCPTGYIPISKDDLTTIIGRSDFNTLIGSSFLNLDFTKQSYYTSTKVNPTITNGGDAKAYVYYSLSLDKTNKPIVDNTQNTYFDSKAINTICKKVLQQFSVSLDGYEGYDLEKGKSYQMKIKNNNVEKYYIQDNNGQTYTTQTFTYTHNGDSNWGCAILNFKLQLFGGVIVGDCLPIWTQNQIAFNTDTSGFKLDSIKTTVLSGVKANVNNGFFFSPGSAPIAPIFGDSNSFYVYYSVQTSNKLMVQKISSVGAPMGSAIDTQQVGQPYDIVSTQFGFVVMASDSTQRAFIQAINKDGSQRWLRILINNGDKPNSPKEQISFFSNDKCELPFGMAAMYNPHNGRLNYARGKIQAIWAHYNHFGFNSDGSRNDHTGDTMISLDADTGLNQNIFWSWGASHSLYQNLHYDGKNLYVASLGDAYPMNIKFQICNIDTYQCMENSKIVQGDIPGNGGGSSSGRQGGFFNIVGNRNQKLFVYQRKACNGGYSGSTSTNAINELAVIKFDSQLKYISTTQVLTGDIASRVNSIKSVAYGQNILIAYTVIPLAEVQNFNRQNSNSQVDEAYFALLSGVDGSTIIQPTKFSAFQINSSDDWRLLENGSIAYTYIDSKGNLNIYYSSPLTIANYPNPILPQDKTYGFGSIVNLKVQPVINNYNKVCVKSGDPNWTSNDPVDNPPVITTQASFKQIIQNLWFILIILTLCY